MEFRTTRGQVKRIKWSELIGDAFSFDGATSEEITGGSLYFFLDEMPAAKDSWRSFLLDIFGVKSESGIPYPPEYRLREHIFGSIQGRPPRIARGPLQVILELCWVGLLKK
jgi:hypothetical protein